MHVRDIKPNNIFIQRRGSEVTEVRLADLEDSAIVPQGSAIIGRQMGNWMWRSPEAHAEGPMNKPSDMFSFGIVVSQTAAILTGSMELMSSPRSVSMPSSSG